MKRAWGVGEPPSDMAPAMHAEFEGEFDDCGAKGENLLSEAGERAMGLRAFDVDEQGLGKGQRQMRRLANERLGL